MSATDQHSTHNATANAVASSGMVCAARRKKPARHMSARNADGWAWVKCGRKAVTVSEFGKPLCRQCSHTDKTLATGGAAMRSDEAGKL